MVTAAAAAMRDWTARLTAFATMRPRVAIILVCLLTMLPGFFTTPPLDRDESRYTQASRQMLETGDFVEIRFQDTARNKKPAGIYWMQAASATLFGGPEAPIWAYRIPSLLGAIGAALATWWAGLALFSRREALLAGLLVGACLSAVIEAHIAKTDAFLLFTVVLAQGALARVYVSHKRGTLPPGWGVTALFWIAQGAGLLIKGPITPMISGLSILMLMIWDRDVKWIARLRPISGAVIAAVLAAPWLIAIWLATDGAFFAEAIGNDMGGKLLGGAERHWGIPGYHILLLSVMFWPAAFAVWPAIRNAWSERRVDAVRFCIAWIVPAWIVFELTPTKLPHYVLPTYPALALLTAAFLLGAQSAAYAGWRKTGTVLWVLVTALLAIAGSILPYVFGDGVIWWLIPFSALILWTVWLVAREGWTTATPRATLRAVAVGIITMGFVFQLVLPQLQDLALSPRLAAAVRAAQPDANIAAASAGYTEPSLVFALGTNTVLTTPRGAAEHLAATPGAIALIEDRFQGRFLAHALENGIVVEAVGVVRGFNYSGGDRVEITLYRRLNPTGTRSQ